ncbi:hypothetical protein RU639_003300 [Aspergillus parasiticus]
MDLVYPTSPSNDAPSAAVDPPELISNQIPPRRIITIKLKHPTPLQNILNRQFTFFKNQVAAKRQKTNPANLREQARGIDLNILRRLAFSPRPHRFISNVRNSLSADIAKWVERDNLGFNFFHATLYKTRFQNDLPPVTWVAAVYYLARDCMKLRYFLRILDKENIFKIPEQGELPPHVIIFA